MEKSRIIGLVGICVCGLTVLSAILALALPSWQVAQGFSQGLWVFCVKSTCEPLYLGHYGISLYVVRAMCFIGVFCIIGALVTGILKVFVMTNRKILGSIAGGLAITAGCFLLAGFALYVVRIGEGNPGRKYGVAFALDVVACPLAWVTAGLFFVETRATVGAE